MWFIFFLFKSQNFSTLYDMCRIFIGNYTEQPPKNRMYCFLFHVIAVSFFWYIRRKLKNIYPCDLSVCPSFDIPHVCLFNCLPVIQCSSFRKYTNCIFINVLLIYVIENSYSTVPSENYTYTYINAYSYMHTRTHTYIYIYICKYVFLTVISRHYFMFALLLGSNFCI